MRTASSLGDVILTFILSEAMMLAVALAFVVCIVTLVKLRRRSCPLRTACIVLAVVCALYLIAIGALVFLFDSSHPPAPPSPAMP